MNKLLPIIFLFLMSNLVSAQQYAITTTGDRVILNDDKTWNYADENTKESGNLNETQSSASDTKVVSKSLSTKTPIKKQSTTKKKTSSSRTYITGPRGGCYYINSSGNKVYVDRSLCR